MNTHDIEQRIAEWRSYADTDFDGLSWPVAEFRVAADVVAQLKATLQWISLTRVDDEDAPLAVKRIVQKAYEGLGLAGENP